MKVTKRLIAFFMAAMMIFSVLPVMNASALTSGKWMYAVVDGGAAIYGHEGAVSEKLTIPSKIDGYPVTRIDEWAFCERTNLKSVTIPSTVTLIGYQAFKGCNKLTSITIPDSVTIISREAFLDCSSLKSITIGKSVKEIRGKAFDNTAYYNNSANWKNGVLYIGDYLIKAKDSVKGSYKIKSGTKCIADKAFYDCTGLTSITIPDSVTSIGNSAFSGCSSLTRITIPDSMTSISDYVFSNCSSLTRITIPDSVTSIGASAFSGCSSLTRITIPDSVTSIGASAFSGCSSLTRITIPDGVTSIDSRAFEDCSSLTSITIPDSVTSIGWAAFSGCRSLKSITIPSSVTSIGGDAFSGTAYYNNSSNWKNGVLYIGNYLIEAKESIKGSYKIKSGTKCIADKAFYDCSGLTSITIPDSVTSIGSIAFYNTAYYNNSSNWKNDVLYIGNHLIEAKYSIKGSYKIKSGTKCIADNAFYDCNSLISVTIPSSVTSIGDEAFYCCFDLSSVSIQSGVTSIGEYAFCGCDITSVTIPGSVKFIGNKAFGYDVCMGDIYLNSNFTIYGHKGSAANTYAKENGFKFVAHKNNYTSKTTKATTSKNGKITYTCTCGYSYSKSIAKISSVVLSSASYTYNGKAKKPTVTVKDSKGNTLKNGTDYTVSYSSGRTNVGKYTVTVTFKGKYSGTKKLTFKIVPKSTSISKLTAGTKKFTAKWYTRTEQTSGYQLQYSTSSKMTNVTKKTLSDTSKNSLTVSGLKAGTKYCVQIRTYKNVKIDGKTYKYYSAWSSVKSVKTK